VNELTIGETGVINGQKVVCVKDDGCGFGCDRCVFCNGRRDIVPCLPWERDDKESVYFAAP
jgi:hypothetical protein